ncbi:helix-turn-helix domain-containing protein [Actinoplanes sp. NPDC049316]|uniref:helix-turn-helix domain-containing protein n=1 Tax=Actinoplanes sp. NPDC049316 TaxID=3154727 RepID=UPI003416E293
MVDRWTVEKAVRASRLEPTGRHIILTLLTYTDADTAAIPEKFTPSLTTLKGDTGYARSTVAEWLNTLEDLGWVIRDRPSVADARIRKKRTVYRLAIPAAVRNPGAPQAGPPGGPAPDTPPLAGPGGGPTGDSDAGPAGGPAPESPRSAGPAPGPGEGPVGPPAGPELVRQADRVGPPAGLNQTSSSVDLGGGARDRAGADHPYIEGPNGYCAVKGCAVSAPMHGVGRPRQTERTQR